MAVAKIAGNFDRAASLYTGALWRTKYRNSYNRNHNSAVPQKQLNLFNKCLLTTGDF